MSKTHVEQGAIERFLECVARWNKWRPLNDPSFFVGQSGRDIDFQSRGFMLIQGEPVEIAVQVILITSKDSPVYFVGEFDVTTDGPLELTDGPKALEHLGKYRRGPNMYAVHRPADLEALFRTYDSVARLNGTPPVFNLP